MPIRTIKKTYHWWQSLPGWVRAGKMLILILLVSAVPLLNFVTTWQQHQDIFDRYYAHFYAEYIKTQSPADARRYAIHYANYYADYYTSEAYQYSLQYALPSATDQSKSFPESSVVAGLNISTQGLALIQEFEGLRLEPYRDVGGKLTIGYGHLLRPGEFYEKLTQEQAEALLQEDVQVAEAVVKRYVQVELTTAQFDALTSLVYNIGPGHFRNSTLLRALNRKDFDRAAEEFLRWNHVGDDVIAGLTRRREREKALFES